MHSTGAILWSTLEDIAFLFDESWGEGKYDANFAVNRFVQPKIDEVWSRVILTMDNVVLIRHQISILKDVASYELPPQIQEIWRVGLLDDQGDLVAEWRPRGYFHPHGQNWRIEHNQLVFDPKPNVASTAQIDYVPSGDVFVHWHDGTSNLGEVLTTTTFKGTKTPTLGIFDRRANAYVGSILRILGKNPNDAASVWEEHIIDSQANDVFTTRTVMSSAVSTGYQYEVVPAGYTAIAEAVSMAGASKFGLGRGMSQKKANQIAIEYAEAIKTITDRLSNLNMRFGDHYDRQTIDNPEMMVHVHGTGHIF